jgi:serine/threonine protein kinase
LMPLTSGTKLGPYEIQSPLGAGGMGEVYRANDTRLDRVVAIEVQQLYFMDQTYNLFTVPVKDVGSALQFRRAATPG